jgi:hypothetical protein
LAKVRLPVLKEEEHAAHTLVEREVMRLASNIGRF